MLALENLLAIFNLIAIPITIFYRFKKNNYLILINPLLYLLIFSYFYLNFSSLFLWDYIQTRQQDISFYTESSVQMSNLFCYWFTFVFFIFYQLSKDNKYVVNPNFSPKKTTFLISLVVALIVAIFFAIIIVLHFQFLVGLLFLGRGQAFELFKKEIQELYPINHLTNILFISTSVLVWRTKNLKWLLLLLLPCILIIFSQARSLAFKALIFAYTNYVLISKKTGLTLILVMAFLIVTLAFYRTSRDVDNWKDFAYISLGDIFESRHTTTITYRRFLESADLGKYLFCSLINPIPLGFEQDFCDAKYLGSGYDDILKEFYQARLGIFYSLDGNIVSESLFYGGTFFGFLSPIIIGGIFYFINKIAIYKTFPGFIFTSLLLSDLRSFIRDSFYDNFINIIVITLVYYIWLILLEKNKFIMIKKSLFDMEKFNNYEQRRLI